MEEIKAELKQEPEEEKYCESYQLSEFKDVKVIGYKKTFEDQKPENQSLKSEEPADFKYSQHEATVKTDVFHKEIEKFESCYGLKLKPLTVKLEKIDYKFKVENIFEALKKEQKSEAFDGNLDSKSEDWDLNHDQGNVDDQTEDLYSLDLSEKSGIPIKIPEIFNSKTKAKYKKKLKFICNICEKRFSESAILRRHIRIHTGERPCECSFCCLLFKTNSMLKNHQSGTHSGIRHECKFCNASFSHANGLSNHILKHTRNKIKTYLCSDCSKSFSSSASLKKHFRSNVHKLNKSATSCEQNDPSTLTDMRCQLFECDSCGKCFHKKYSLAKHIQSVHLKAESLSFECDVCSRFFRTRSDLAEHIKYVHLKETLPVFVCEVCGQKSRSKKNYFKHIKLHDNTFPFSCTECSKSFKEKGGLNSHIQVIHKKEKPFVCSTCGCSFKKKGNLKTHIENHHSVRNKNYSCDTCGMGFDFLRYLKRHKYIHMDKPTNKKLICDECGLRCRSKKDMEIHVYTHIGGAPKPYKCEICEWAFSKLSRLKRHQLVHSKERPYKCESCFKTYKDSHSLEDHKKAVHLREDWFCKPCGKIFKYKKSLKRHCVEKQCKAIKNDDST